MSCSSAVFLKNSCGFWGNLRDVGFNGFAS
jgi:hypothetical protein